jgi:hypothetical protein
LEYSHIRGFPVANNLDKINIGSIVRTVFPLKGGGKLVLDGVVIKILPPSSLEIDFVPDQLSDALRIDNTENCLFSYELGEKVCSFSAAVKKISEECCVELELIETVTHKQKRNFFRADVNLQVKLRQMRQRAQRAQRAKPASIKTGELINISGGGILGLFGERIEEGRQISIELTLPGKPGNVVSCGGYVVRANSRNDGEYEVAIHFDDIDQTTRDKIISFCYAEERKQLRMRVQVRSTRLNLSAH